MGRNYKNEEDKHLDHSRDNPCPRCFFCRKNGWAERDDSALKERKRKAREDLIERREQELEEVETKMRDSFLPTVKLQKRKEFLEDRLEVLTQ